MTSGSPSQVAHRGSLYRYLEDHRQNTSIVAVVTEQFARFGIGVSHSGSIDDAAYNVISQGVIGAPAGPQTPESALQAASRSAGLMRPPTNACKQLSSSARLKGLPSIGTLQYRASISPSQAVRNANGDALSVKPLGDRVDRIAIR